MILLIDNYDSYVQNVARYLRKLGQQTQVVRNDAISLTDIVALSPDAIVISPGPCTPSEAGISLAIVREFSGKVPILGICLGHQAIGQSFGAQVVRAAKPMHGKTSLIQHDGLGIFAGLDNPLIGCRYHSLVIDPATLPADLVPVAWTREKELMAVAHEEHLTIGLQFHPESILTASGFVLLRNFLKLAGCQLPHADLLTRSELSTGEPCEMNEEATAADYCLLPAGKPA
jgi:anthranilate synthase/aminodeoxychorismate synthase-like glutamine amidotransferase